MTAGGAGVAALGAAFTAPVYALPLDAFRVLAGLVGLLYFARTLRETGDFSSPNGLIDHRLSLRLLPPTRLGLFRPALPEGAFRAVFALACVASVMVAAGVRVKPAAVFLFLVAVSTYRWNMLVTYVDDAFVHYVFFWLLLLPVGETLTLEGWLRHGSGALDAWAGVTVPGGAVRIFLLNLAVAYFVAGAYKWTSPMWRNGSALCAILQLPVAFAPHRWSPRRLPALRAACYGALVTEPFFPLIFVLPSGSAAKWAAVAVVVAFHLGIVATLRIPFANLAMLGAVPIVLRDEIMHGLLGMPPLPAEPGGFGVPEAVGAVVLGAIVAMLLLEVHFEGRLTSSGLWKTSVSGFRRNPAVVALWCVGIAQSYRLFDWIDLRNYHARYEVLERGADGSVRPVDPRALFPVTIRHLLLQSYLHGSIWHQIEPVGLREARRSILERYAARYAARHPDAGAVEVFAVRQRVTSDNLSLERGVRRPLLRFSCAGGRAECEFACVNPEPGYWGAPGAAQPVELPAAPLSAAG